MRSILLILGTCACTVDVPREEVPTLVLALERIEATVTDDRVELVGAPGAAEPAAGTVVAYPLQITALVERSSDGRIAEDGSFSLTTAASEVGTGTRRLRLTVESATAV